MSVGEWIPLPILSTLNNLGAQIFALWRVLTHWMHHVLALVVLLFIMSDALCE